MTELDLKKRDRRFMIALTVVISLVALLVFAFARTHYAFTFWFGGVRGDDANLANIVMIGSWHTDDDHDDPPIEIPVANFDEVVEILRTRDAHLFHGYRHIHILGHDLSDDVPTVPTQIQTYDVLVFKIGHTILAVQVVGPLDTNLFSSWATLQAGVTNANIAINTGAQTFSMGNVYTRAHGSINHAGNQWLARHDNVTTTPQLGADWFMISEEWVAQAYPLGSIVRYGHERFRKVTSLATAVTPGTTHDWEVIPYLSRDAFNVPFWDSEPMWHSGTVVNHLGIHYVSMVDYNEDVPGTSSSWQVFTRFNPAETVPWLHAGIGRPWQTGDFVRATVGNRTNFFFREGAGGNAPGSLFADAWAWHIVSDWYDLVGVMPWSDSMRASSGVTGTLVEYDGIIYRLMGTWIPDATPPNGTAHWERILRWEETQAPALWGPGNWTRGSMVTANNEYFIVAEEMGTWYTPANLNTSPRFRRINAWDATQVYTQFSALGWGTGIAHAYTMQNGQRIFWEFIGTTPTAGQVPGESPMWQQFAFQTTQSIVITEIAGRLVVWDRAAGATANPNPGAPSITNPNWVRRITPVNHLFTFTQATNGLITLWRNHLPAGNPNQPGTDTSWSQIDFPTGLSFVYTINAAGIYHFWYSAGQSSTTPAWVSPHWQMLREELFTDIPLFFYMISAAGMPIYYEVNPGIAWRQVRTAWIGSSEVAGITGGNTMINHWNPQNSYNNGDIVVYEDTYTNTFRYFRMRAGVNANLATGISPFSPAGNTFWQPIR